MLLGRTMAILTISGFLALTLFIFMIELPSFEELENPKYDQASIIYDVKGETFGRYFIEDRIVIEYEEISQNIKNATIVTEDERFFDHSGIDFRSLFRVGFKTLLLQKESSGGGSTISQQLAKLLYERPSTKGKSFLMRTISLLNSKLKEWIIAVKLEKSYTKEEILALYLNKFEFINGAHGVEAAAQIYFNKSQKDLDISEAALLVGMLKNPVMYNPKRFPQKSKERRNSVLALLKNNDHITKNEYDTLSTQDIDLSEFKRVDQSAGYAPYFRSELTKELRKVFKKEGIKKSDGTEYDLYRDGLKIYTTIDLEYQKLAEEAVWEHLKYLQDRYWRLWKNKDPWTYETNDYQKKLRANILEAQCKSSDRYQNLRKKYFNESAHQITQKFPSLPMVDELIPILDSIVQNKLSFRQATQRGVFESQYQDQYHKLINSEDWRNIVSDYAILQKAFKEEFSKPIKMKVFDYSDAGEKEIELSPLDSVRFHKMHLQSGFLVVEPQSGHVKAWVGGPNHKYFKFDHVTMRRSVGSTMKPFVYTQAMAVANIAPCDEFEDIQYSISPSDLGFNVDKEWSPANADEKFTGNKYNLFHGLLYSKNSITVKLLKEMGTVEPIISLMNNLGIDKDLKLDNGRPAIPRLPSICLGAVDLTLWEMTGAYTAYANNGTFVKPVIISRIEDRNGRVIYQSVPERKSAINSLHNAVMVSMLKNNVSGKFGLGVKSDIGGKTGTTNDYADGWFMAITPSLVMGAWTGGDDKWIRFLDLNDGQGYTTARPIAQKFLKKLENQPNIGYDFKARFVTPPAGYDEWVDCAQYKTIQPSVERSLTKKEKLKQDVFDDDF